MSENTVKKTENTGGGSLRVVTRPSVMVIESDRDLRRQLCDDVRAMNFDAFDAENRREADFKMSQTGGRIDAVILDWAEIQAADPSWIKNLPKNSKGRTPPVVALIGEGQNEEIKAAIEAGIIYYITKPVAPGLINMVIGAVVKDAERQSSYNEAYQKQRAGFHLMESCSFHLSTLTQAEDIACLLASFFPNPQRVLIGIGELLTNAIEHGNLGIGYEQKANLMQAELWQEEVTRRQALPENNGKTVQVIFQRTDKGYYVSIKDQGAGFDWRNYLRLSLARAGEHHGRGIALANLVSFDKLAYNEVGNQVTGFVSAEPDLSW